MKTVYDIAIAAAQETKALVLDEVRNNALWVVNDHLQCSWFRTPGECRTVIYTLALANVITSTDMNALLSLVESVPFENWKEHKFQTLNPFFEEGKYNMTRLLNEWTAKQKAVPEPETV